MTEYEQGKIATAWARWVSENANAKIDAQTEKTIEKAIHHALNNATKGRIRKIIIASVSSVFAFIVGICVLYPLYNVWSQGMAGKGELRRAEQNRQIAINEAMALKDAAKFRAEAEVERAKGVQAANSIIAESLGGPEGYLRYLYIDALHATSCDLIYVPTEGGLPILEAGRRVVPAEPKPKKENQ